MSSTGTRMETSHFFADGGATTVQGRGCPSGPAPARNAATASMGRTVALSPMRGTWRPASASSRSNDNARWEPRFDPATA